MQHINSSSSPFLKQPLFVCGTPTKRLTLAQDPFLSRGSGVPTSTHAFERVPVLCNARRPHEGIYSLRSKSCYMVFLNGLTPFCTEKKKGHQARSSLRWRISWKSQLSFWYGRWGGLVEKQSVRPLLEIHSLGNTLLGKCECDWYCDLWVSRGSSDDQRGHPRPT